MPLDGKAMCKLGAGMSIFCMVLYVLVISTDHIACDDNDQAEICSGFFKASGTLKTVSQDFTADVNLNDCTIEITTDSGLDLKMDIDDEDCHETRASLAMYIIACIFTVVCAIMFVLVFTKQTMPLLYPIAASMIVSLVFGMVGFSLMVDQFLEGDDDTWGYSAVFGLLAWLVQFFVSAGLFFRVHTGAQEGVDYTQF